MYLLDVGPDMQDALPWACRALRVRLANQVEAPALAPHPKTAAARSKLMCAAQAATAANAQAAVVCFGTDGKAAGRLTLQPAGGCIHGQTCVQTLTTT